MLYQRPARALPYAFATLLLTVAFIIQGRAGILPKVELIEFQKGAESAAGSFDKSGAVHGNMFTLNSFEPGESRHLTISFDYLTNAFAPTNTQIIGGSWTMVIVRKGEYYRTLYGDVVTGEIVDANPELCPDHPPAAPSARSIIAELRTNGILGDDAPAFSYARLDLRADGPNASGQMEVVY